MTSRDKTSPALTASDDYALRLQSIQQVWWKKILPVQAPYRWNLRRQKLGRTLEIGCGIGRNFAALDAGSVGVDHNKSAVRVARANGAVAYDAEEWPTAPCCQPGHFDALLFAHILEHLDEAEARALIAGYLVYLRPGGRIFLICPQEKGHASDPTHVRFTDGEALSRLASSLGLVPEPWFSFPFPRAFGKLFIYNEFCLIARKPD